MTSIVFLVDTSASMTQKTYLGLNYMEVVHQFVDEFIKVRQRDVNSKTDRYLLMSYEDYPQNVKVSWKESSSIQVNKQLSNLLPSGRGQFSKALFDVFRYLNLARVKAGIETWGHGCIPTNSEPVVIIALADLTSDSFCEDFLVDNKFPKLEAPGSELIDEPLRWDYRLFVISISLPGHSPEQIIEPPMYSDEHEQAEMIVEQMNGHFFELSSHRNVPLIIQSINQHVQQTGVFVKFSRYDHDPKVQPLDGENIDEWKSQTVFISRVNKDSTDQNKSIWPIPEAFWPELTMMMLPTRKAVPEVTFVCNNVQPISSTDVVVDEYKLEPGPLTQAFIDRKDPNMCWQIFVVNSSAKKNDLGRPFGYLKLNENMQTVNLFIMPYNYPALFNIVEESTNWNLNKTPAFKNKVNTYFKGIPLYYVSPLREALSAFTIPHPYLNDAQPAPQIYRTILSAQLKQFRDQGRDEYEEIQQEILVNNSAPDPKKVSINNGIYKFPMVKVIPRLHIDPSEPSKVGVLPNYQLDESLSQNQMIAVADAPSSKAPSSKFLNPFDIEREELIECLEKMRINLDLHFADCPVAVFEGGMPGQQIKLHEAEDLHFTPVAKMSDYKEYNKRLADIGMSPKREVEEQTTKTVAFGNPFKLDKKQLNMSDIEKMPDIIVDQPGAASPTRSEKRVDLSPWKGISRKRFHSAG